MLISYQLPEYIKSISKISNEIPSQHKRLQIQLPGTRVNVTTGEWGIVIHQIVKLGDNFFSEFYVHSNIDLRITVTHGSGLISLYAVYDGSMLMRIGENAFVFRARYHSLHYTPRGTVQILEINAGMPFHSAILAPERSLLARLAITFTRLDEILNAYTGSRRKHVMLPFTRFRNTSRNELSKLKNVRYSGIGMDEYLKNRISDYVLGYVNQIHSEYNNASISAVTNDKIESLLSMIKKEPEMLVKTEVIARKLGIPPNILKSAFQLKVGTSLMSYVIRERIHKAKELLKNKNCTVAEISLAVGYNDHSYFTRLFKKMTGFTPTEMRGVEE